MLSSTEDRIGNEGGEGEAREEEETEDEAEKAIKKNRMKPKEGVVEVDRRRRGWSGGEGKINSFLRS